MLTSVWCRTALLPLVLSTVSCRGWDWRHSLQEHAVYFLCLRHNRSVPRNWASPKSDFIFINENSHPHSVAKLCWKVVSSLLRHCCASRCPVSASNRFLSFSTISASHLVKYSRRFEASRCSYLAAQNWNLAKHQKIRFRSGKRLIAGIPVLITVDLVFVYALEKGVGNDAELLRLGAMEGVPGRAAGWWVQRGALSRGGVIRPMVNLADFRISSSLLGIADVELRWASQCNMVVNAWWQLLIWVSECGTCISEMVCWAVREEQFLLSPWQVDSVIRPAVARH